MAEKTRWCNMNYTIMYNIAVLFYIYQSITGSISMINYSFMTAVIVGLSGILAALSKHK